MKYSVYFHKNVETGTVFYVGIGKGRRPYNRDHRNKYWQNYVKKYNGFNVEIVHSNLTHAEACNLETQYIKTFGRKEFESEGALVNMTLGGEGASGRVMKAETKQKIIDGNKKWLLANKHPRAGVKYSAEQKLKMSQALKGKMVGEKHPMYGKRRPESVKNALRIANTGKRASQETKDKLSAMRIGEKHPLYGRHFSEETKEKMRQSALNRNEQAKTNIVNANKKRFAEKRKEVAWEL